MTERKARLRFRLRTLLMLVMAIGVALAAWRAWVEPYRVERAAMRAIGEAGGLCVTRAGGPVWLRAIFGDGAFQEVGQVELGQSADAEVLEHLARLRHLMILRVDCGAFADDHLARLSRLPKLQIVTLTRTNVSPDAVDALRERRPDIVLTVRLTLEELATATPGMEWSTDGARQAGVPASVRQWEGRRVEIVGQPEDYSDLGQGRIELAPLGARLPPGGVAVALRSPIDPKEWNRWFESHGVEVEGILKITPDLSDRGTSVYQLSDATFEILPIPDPARFDSFPEYLQSREYLESRRHWSRDGK